MVLDWKLWAAVCTLTSRNDGSILRPDDACTKTGRPVHAVLHKKHPPLHTPDLSNPDSVAFSNYGILPDIIPVDCPVDVAETVARKLSGGASCSSIDTALLRSMLIRHGRASAKLWEELSKWARWLANTLPPWAAYRAMHQG
ncbi:hypothetical protein ACHAW6_006762 [Cyclotella cf. meneghiniana]